MIDWRTMSDEEIEAALKEHERRSKRPAEPSPAPWTNNTFQVVDANGVEVCHCGGTRAGRDGATPRPDRAEANARYCTVGPDGLALDQLIIKNGGGKVSMELIRSAQALITKAVGL